jgi:hypothetical protein
MPHSSVLARLGLFVLPEFLDASLCARVREEIEAASTVPAGIVGDSNPGGAIVEDFEEQMLPQYLLKPIWRYNRD